MGNPEIRNTPLSAGVFKPPCEVGKAWKNNGFRGIEKGQKSSLAMIHLIRKASHPIAFLRMPKR